MPRRACKRSRLSSMKWPARRLSYCSCSFEIILPVRFEIYEWGTWPRAALSPHNAAKHNQDPHEKTTQGNQGLIPTLTVCVLAATSPAVTISLAQRCRTVYQLAALAYVKSKPEVPNEQQNHPRYDAPGGRRDWQPQGLRHARRARDGGKTLSHGPRALRRGKDPAASTRERREPQCTKAHSRHRDHAFPPQGRRRCQGHAECDRERQLRDGRRPRARQHHREHEPPPVRRGQGKAQEARAIIFDSPQHSPPHGGTVRRFFIGAESPAPRPRAHCPDR